MVLFVQHVQILITFQNIALVNANITISLYSSALEWYISKFSNFENSILNNNLEIKSRVNILSY